MKPAQFRTKAAAEAFVLQQRIDPKCNAHKPSRTLKCMHEKISQYLEERRCIHKKSGSVGLLTRNKDMWFSALCQGNGDMLIAGSNSRRGIYSITTTFDGVGILGTVTLLTSYMDQWKYVSALALSGDKLAICTDGIIYLHTLSQGTTEVVNGPNMFPVSSNAMNVAFLGGNFVRVIASR